MSTPAKPRTVIVCLPAEGWAGLVDRRHHHRGRAPPTLAPVFPVRRGLFRFLSGVTRRGLLGAVRRHGPVTHTPAAGHCAG
jgi:hypothetical protein